VKTLGKCALGETGAQPARKGYLSRMQAAKTSTHLRLAQAGPSGDGAGDGCVRV